ncbi:MAG: hypothetical protein IIA54_07165 [Chloroflexi bacterium]|nr:hypothetical protein [Chloroflexota bacterium]
MQDHSSQREIVYRAAGDGAPDRDERLVRLLAIGIERWLRSQEEETRTVDFRADTVVHDRDGMRGVDEERS